MPAGVGCIIHSGVFMGWVGPRQSLSKLVLLSIWAYTSYLGQGLAIFK